MSVPSSRFRITIHSFDRAKRTLLRGTSNHNQQQRKQANPTCTGMQPIDSHYLQQAHQRQQQKYPNMEPTIPIAYGEAIPPLTPPPIQPHRQQQQQQQQPPPQRPALTNSRSSRLLLPQNQAVDESLSASTFNLLKQQGYSSGLSQALVTNKTAFPLAIWVVDNSGSMQTRDGHRIIENKRALKFVECSRWSELQQSVDYHCQMAALLRKPTAFRLLNDPGRVAGQQQFSIADKNEASIDHDLAVAQSTMMNSQPGGVTPLCEHILEIRDNILALEPQLRRDGTKVAIVLATDGIPTDRRGYSDDFVKQQFVQALRSLEGYPIWMVVRLCTDEENVVQYWNDLDNQLELSLEVLDDFQSEAEEVHQVNKWLTYGLPLHRMREMGFHHKIFDMLDERKLSKDEVREFCRILFGTSMDEAPDPEVDWKGFCNVIAACQSRESKQWNPLSKRMEPWIDMKKLNKDYKSKGYFGLF